MGKGVAYPTPHTSSSHWRRTLTAWSSVKTLQPERGANLTLPSDNDFYHWASEHVCACMCLYLLQYCFLWQSNFSLQGASLSLSSVQDAINSVTSLRRATVGSCLGESVSHSVGWPRGFWNLFTSKVLLLEKDEKRTERLRREVSMQYFRIRCPSPPHSILDRPSISPSLPPSFSTHCQVFPSSTYGCVLGSDTTYAALQH